MRSTFPPPARCAHRSTDLPGQIRKRAAANLLARHLQRQLEAADRQIDALVYELYGLTDKEIKIVEAGA
jgi:hypothetical protein